MRRSSSLPVFFSFFLTFFLSFTSNLFSQWSLCLFGTQQLTLPSESLYHRAHFHVQELFTDPAQLMTGGIGQSGGFDMFQQQQQQMGYNVNQSVISTGQQGYPTQQPGGMITGGGVIPVTALTNLGVAAEAVGQISELKQYLSRQVQPFCVFKPHSDLLLLISLSYSSFLSIFYYS